MFRIVKGSFKVPANVGSGVQMVPVVPNVQSLRFVGDGVRHNNNYNLSISVFFLEFFTCSDHRAITGRGKPRGSGLAMTHSCSPRASTTCETLVSQQSRQPIRHHFSPTAAKARSMKRCHRDCGRCCGRRSRPVWSRRRAGCCCHQALNGYRKRCKPFKSVNCFAPFNWSNVTERSNRSRRFKPFKPAMSLTSFSRSKRSSPFDNRARGA